MAQNNSIDSLQSVKWFIECGNQDQLNVVNKNLHEILKNRNLNHIYRPRDGKHDWIFWREGIYQGIKFMNQGFQKK